MADPRLDYEAGQTAVAMTTLSDSGDNKTFNSAAELWSNRAGFTPTVRPNGVLTGCVVTPAASGLDDKVDVSAGTAWIAGVEVEITAAPDETITRASETASETHKISSVTITASGDIAIVAGADHTAFDTGRGEDGGPPWIPNTSIEIAQVKLTDDDDNAAPIVASEIVQVPGSSRETALFPVWEQERIRVSNGALGYAGITFASALDACHSEDAGSTIAAKKVYASYYTPTFAQIPKASDFVRPANSYSVSSTEYYGGAMGTRSQSIGQGGFSAYSNTLNEGFMVFEGEELWFKFRNDRLVTVPAVYCQGVLGIAETFPTDGSIEISATISAEAQGERILA
jgi:hypothetical protein